MGRCLLQGDRNDLAETSAKCRKPVQLDRTRVGRLSRMGALQDQAMGL
ncbi:MAG: hypothetical protein OEM59_04935 [Rhodospirillales bacterium]|nr:hypothetical protein [Rhodospirillales bacterium]